MNARSTVFIISHKGSKSMLPGTIKPLEFDDTCTTNRLREALEGSDDNSIPKARGQLRIALFRGLTIEALSSKGNSPPNDAHNDDKRLLVPSTINLRHIFI